MLLPYCCNSFSVVTVSVVTIATVAVVALQMLVPLPFTCVVVAAVNAAAVSSGYQNIS